MLRPEDSLDLAALRDAYADGQLTPPEMIEAVLARIAARGDDRVWIHLLPRERLLGMAEELASAGREGRPLYGIPFAIKDNIDLADAPTTAACPDFTYLPKDSAFAVKRLVDAGAIPIGKTNLDQFATGLNGTRSPYGFPSSALSGDHVPGGSSSGSAVSVAAGLVSFALGTDTAGSGRVPAQFNNILGLKPSRGLISTSGVVPACRSLDCLSIFALTADDAADVLAVAKGFDPADPFSRKEAPVPMPASVRGARFGIPAAADLEFFGNAEGAALFNAMVDRIRRLGGVVVEVDLKPFLETASLLYDGPWVAERYAAIRDFIGEKPDALLPVTRDIIGGGARPLAADAYAAYYRLKEMRRATAPVWSKIDALLVPTAGRQYTIAEMLAEPVKRNSELGHYTNFMNLLDLAGIAIPAGFGASGLPFGVTLVGPAFSDAGLLALGDALHRDQDLAVGATGIGLPPKRPMAKPAGTVKVAVCGAHMAGLPLNWQLTDRGGKLVRVTRSAPAYRLYALPGGPPARPGMVRAERGCAIDLEVWEMPLAAFGSFVDGIPPPLGIGTVELEDGEKVKGFICESIATTGARDITELGGWRRYLAESEQPVPVGP